MSLMSMPERLQQEKTVKTGNQIEEERPTQINHAKRKGDADLAEKNQTPDTKRIELSQNLFLPFLRVFSSDISCKNDTNGAYLAMRMR